MVTRQLCTLQRIQFSMRTKQIEIDCHLLRDLEELQQALSTLMNRVS